MFFFGSGCRVAIEFADDKNGTRVFGRNDAVRGTVTVEVAGGKKLEHLGIKIELVGQIEMFYDRGNFHDFTSLVRELDAVRTRAAPRTRRAPDSRASRSARARRRAH